MRTSCTFVELVYYLLCSMQDAQGLLQLLKSLVSDYEWEQGRPLSTVSLSRLLSNYLYYRRSFPYYTHNVVAGLDAAGTGAVYGYDSVGSFERVKVDTNSLPFHHIRLSERLSHKKQLALLSHNV
jgi:Proteasome subunit